MHETDDEVRWLQELLDRSHAGMRAYMRSIVTPERALNAKQVVTYLQGVKQVALATTTATGAPRVAPVDGLFIHGRFHVASGAAAARVRDLRSRSQVSLTHVLGDELAITVHGTAALLPRGHANAPALEKVWIEIYGSSPFAWADEVLLVRIDPALMFAHAAAPDRYSDGTPPPPHARPVRLVETAPRAEAGPRTKAVPRPRPGTKPP